MNYLFPYTLASRPVLPGAEAWYAAEQVSGVQSRAPQTQPWFSEVTMSCEPEHPTNTSQSLVSFDNLTIKRWAPKVRVVYDYYPFGLSWENPKLPNDPEGMHDHAYQDKELQFAEFSTGHGLALYDFHARMYDPATGRWLVPDPAKQFHNPYLAMGNNPVSYVDPDGEFAVLAALAVKMVITAVKAAKLAKGAAVLAKTAQASKYAAVMGKAVTKKGIATGLKSGTINTISNFDVNEGLGWNTLGDFAAGFAGGSIGYGAESKLIGMGIGGLGTWAVNGASFDYSGGQEFVGGALSSYVGIGKAVKGKHALFKQSEGVKTLAKFDNSNLISNALKKHGDSFLKYGIQNNAYDFAYSKQKDFMSRGWGHLQLFVWGGFSGTYQRYSFDNLSYFGTTPLYLGIDWGINGAIKKQFKGVKTDGSQLNKAVLSYFKWMIDMQTWLK